MSGVQVETVEWAEVEPDTFVVRALGALDGEGALELKETLLPLAGVPGARVLVDLGAARTVEPTVVGILTAAAHVVRMSDGELVIAVRDDGLRHMLDESGLGDLARLERTLADGVERTIPEAE